MRTPAHHAQPFPVMVGRACRPGVPGPRIWSHPTTYKPPGMIFSAAKPLEGLRLPSVPHGSLVAVQSVAAAGQFEIFRRHLVCLQCLVEHSAIVRGDDRIILGMGQEDRRRLSGDLLLVGKQVHHFRLGIAADQVCLRAAVASRPS